MPVLMVEIKLPYPPTINTYWRRVGNQTIISKGGRLFRQQVLFELRLRKLPLMQGPLSVDVDVFPPDRKRRDIDNILKATLDALEHGGLYDNDNQICKLTVQRRDKVEGGSLVVRVTEL